MLWFVFDMCRKENETEGMSHSPGFPAPTRETLTPLATRPLDDENPGHRHVEVDMQVRIVPTALTGTRHVLSHVRRT